MNEYGQAVAVQWMSISQDLVCPVAKMWQEAGSGFIVVFSGIFHYKGDFQLIDIDLLL
jgi:hypothetical protein